MIDGALPFQSVLLATLLADAGVKALVGSRVWDDAPAKDPDEPATFAPYITFGEPQTLHFANDGYRGCSIFFPVHTWAQAGEGGRSHLTMTKLINAAVIEAVWGDKIASPPGWLLHSVSTAQGGNRILREPDNATAHGIVTLRADMTKLAFVPD